MNQALEILLLKENKNRFNSSVFFFILVFFFVVISIKPGTNLFAILGLCLFAYLLLEFFWLTGKTFPIRNLFSVFVGLQMLVGPYLSYYWYGDYQLYRMHIDDSSYFSYAFPATLFFVIGLRFKTNVDSEIVPVDNLTSRFQLNKLLPYQFIVIGLVFTLFENIQGVEYAFVFVLLAYLKYVGLFILILSREKLPLIPACLVYGSLLIKAALLGMFQDLLIWSTFLGMILSIKYTFSLKVKITAFAGFLIFSFLIQSIKESYRAVVWSGEEEASLTAIQGSFQQVQASKGILSNENIGSSLVRINQGWILSSVMENVPEKVDHTKGYLTRKYLEAAILPRFLAPDKLKAGSRDIFITYSGVPIAPGTSMGLGIFSDAYIEFGKVGGWIYLFFYGLLYNLCLKIIKKSSDDYPYLFLFIPLIFIYPVRPDSETQTVLGHLFKASFFVFVIHKLIQKKFLSTNSAS